MGGSRALDGRPVKHPPRPHEDKASLVSKVSSKELWNSYSSVQESSRHPPRKSHRKMASPTLMTCFWSGVNFTCRIGSE